jgi:NitT/TauT family transport system substrate-binding protein
VPLGGGGLVPNMLAGNVDAIVLYSPLSFQEMENKEAHAILDFAKELPPHMQGVWIASEKLIKEKPKMVQGAVNALFGAVAYMQEHRDYSIKLISEIDDVPASVAAREYEVTINDLLKDGAMNDQWIDAALEYARAGGVRPDVPLKNLYTTKFKPVPTKPGS